VIYTATLHVRQQLQRMRGELSLGPVKTHAGNRSLPLPDLAVDGLKLRAEQQIEDRATLGNAWPATDLVFTTRTGRPVEPRNLVRSFRRICDHNKIRLIKIHHLRHTAASLLKELQVPARDAQTILGHTRISTTLEIYTASAEDAQRDALRKLDGLLDNREN
jgi:integrase